MKYLLSFLIAGFVCWMISDLIELVVSGYNPSVYYLTSAYHVLAGIGVWGLYLFMNVTQNRGRNLLRLTGTALTSSAYLALTLFPFHVMWSGLEISHYLDTQPVYKLIAFAWLIGIVLFSIAVHRSGAFPKWAGIVMLIGFVIFSTGRQIGLPLFLININSILLSAVMIYLGYIGLKGNRKKISL